MTAAHLALLGLLCITPAQSAQPVNPDAKTQKEFTDRVTKYLELRKSLEGKLSPLPDKAEPEVITRHQRELLTALQRARSDAKPGDLFTEDVRHLIRRLIAGALSRQGSAPPQALLALPRLPDEELQYRVMGTRLLLLDSRANMVVDYMDHALRE